MRHLNDGPICFDTKHWAYLAEASLKQKMKQPQKVDSARKSFHRCKLCMKKIDETTYICSRGHAAPWLKEELSHKSNE